MVESIDSTATLKYNALLGIGWNWSGASVGRTFRIGVNTENLRMSCGGHHCGKGCLSIGRLGSGGRVVGYRFGGWNDEVNEVNPYLG